MKVTVFMIIVGIIFLCIFVGLLTLIVRALLKYIHSKDVRQEKSVVRKSLGEALKVHRTQCKMTQEFVAETIGVSRQAVSKWENGADDYVTKPFSMSVLISKISAMLKRTEKTISNVVQTGELTFYINEKRVTKGNDIISITPTDWKLLMAFIEHPRHILSRNQLLESLWDVNSDYVDENAVAVNIRRLREKIEPDPSNPVYIKNVRGLGYVWEMRCERQ